MRLILTISLSLVMILVSQTSLAGVTCDDKLNACDKALNLSQQVIEDYRTQVSNYRNESELDKQIIADYRAKDSSPLRDPVKVAAGTTVLLTVILIATGHIK